MKIKKIIFISTSIIMTLPIASAVSCANKSHTSQKRPWIPLVPARIIVPVPSIAKGKLTGWQWFGHFSPEMLKGTKVEMKFNDGAINGSLTNGIIVSMTYRLLSNNIWSNNTNEPVTVKYIISGLNDKKISKPTETNPALYFTGVNHDGTFVMPSFAGTTINIIYNGHSLLTPPKTLSNNDKVKLEFKLNKHLYWEDGTSNDYSLTYTVSNLSIKVKKPTNKNYDLKFTGLNGGGTFKLINYDGTTIEIKKGGTQTTPSKELSNDDIVELSFTLKNGYIWNDGEPSTVITLTYRVSGLTKRSAPKNTTMNISNFNNYSTYNENTKTLIIWENIVGIMPNTFHDKNNDWINNLILPGTLLNIYKGIFNRFSIKKISLGDGIQSIGSGAFASAELTNLIIPDSVISLGGGIDPDSGTDIPSAFESSPLISVVIGKGLETLNSRLFPSAELTTLNIPGNIKIIATGAFSNLTMLTHLTISNGVIEIDPNSFYAAELTSLIIPNSVTSIGDSAFYSSPLKSLKLSDKLEIIEGSVFYNSQLTDLIIPDSVGIIGQKAFYSSPLKSLKLSDLLYSIKDEAFYYSQLTDLIIPDSVETIGPAAFTSAPINHLTFLGDISTAPELSNKYTFGNTYISAINGASWEDWAAAEFPDDFK